ncbi:FAD-binding oxidoreductase [Chitinophaga sp. GbtcB8]|uniref:FAD-binding oxidoreductase n=1 Tax=Chitinophaga sp. GbtcB8 TaxID=2824753 RepID=UPI001C31095E|nr:FAD-binding oxidoreductase [Chitinophaga sp. GbtcB8]
MRVELSEVYAGIRQVVGDKYLLSSPEQLQEYSRDCTSREEILPWAVILPGTAEEVAGVVKICNEHKTGLTIRGGGTGVSGGALSHVPGFILSVERLNRIIEINKIDRLAVVEAGVVTQVLQEAVRAEGLCFPQNISSAGGSFIGGNVAVSSGSPKSLKYGATRNLLLNMEVVLADGQIIWTGRNITKNATGYNLTQLLAGSEGTLGIITKVVLQLSDPVEELLILAPFRSVQRLFDCVHLFFEKGFSASSMEFVDRRGYELVSAFLQQQPFGRDTTGLLWIETEGKHKAQLLEEMAEISEFIYPFIEDDVLVAETRPEISRLWEFRKRVGDAVVNYTPFRDIDIVVPRSRIHQMYTAIESTARHYGFDYTVLGHIGNGNFHVNIFENTAIPAAEWQEILHHAIAAIYADAVALGGTLSGEHGIGQLQRSYLNLALPEHQILLMKNIKKMFDPNNILNPGKIFS